MDKKKELCGEFCNIAEEYLISAKKIKTRMDELRKKAKISNEKNEIENRINLLTAEYYQLIKTSNYLSNYYN